MSQAITRRWFTWLAALSIFTLVLAPAAFGRVNDAKGVVVFGAGDATPTTVTIHVVDAANALVFSKDIAIPANTGHFAGAGIIAAVLNADGDFVAKGLNATVETPASGLPHTFVLFHPKGKYVGANTTTKETPPVKGFSIGPH